MATLFGRTRELDAIERRLAAACAGCGGLMLLSGEAGIGKSSLGQAAAESAQARGMRVLHGRGWEIGGSTAYWPWIQVFRSLGSPVLGRALGDHDALDETGQGRFRAFDAAARALGAATPPPLFVFLDDLHSADVPSLLLLLFLSRQLAQLPLLVLGTTREIEPGLDGDVRELLGKLAREAETLAVGRLNEGDVRSWVSARGGHGADVSELFRVSEGNPLFVDELLRTTAHGQAWLKSPSIDSVLNEHLGRVSAETRAVLRVAAVHGREFHLRDLAATCGTDVVETLEHLERAVLLGIAERTDVDSFQFTHLLLRDRCYGSLPPADRAELHARIGLLAQAEGRDPLLVARHLLEGAESVGAERAVESALEAARSALERMAFEAAVEVAERGLALLPNRRSRLGCALAIARADGLVRSGHGREGRAACFEAGALAKELGLPDEQARAALAYASEITALAQVDSTAVDLLAEAVSALGAADSALAAAVRARAAAAEWPPPNEVRAVDIVALGGEAVAMARRVGDQPTLLYALQCYSGLRFGMPSDESFALDEECLQLARKHRQGATLLRRLPPYAVGLLERGQHEAARAALAEATELHATLPDRRMRFRLPMLRAGFAFFSGELALAERLGDEALALGEQDESGTARGEWALQRIALAIARGDPPSILPDADRVLEFLEPTRRSVPARAWVLAVSGAREHGRAVLRGTEMRTAGLPELVFAAEACTLLEDRASAAAIADVLARRCFGRTLFWGLAHGYVIGSIPRLLGNLAHLRGEAQLAADRYRDAVSLAERSGERATLGLARKALAGVDGPATVVEASRERAGSSAPLRVISLTREGEVWAINGGAGPVRVKHSKGLSYLSELVARPRDDVHVLQLIGAEKSAGDAGPVLDARAKAEYRARLAALDEELASAEGLGDGPRGARAREEIEALAQQLAGAMGLGGRDRRSSSDVERARVNVQRRLRDAIECIAACDSELGRYLAATVKTGSYCSYNPV